MARLPTPATIVDLRSTSATSIAATIRWDGDDSFAELIRGLYIRFLLSNLADLGVDEDIVSTEMESWDDYTDVGMPQPRIIPGSHTLLLLQYFDLSVPITEEEAKVGEYLFEWRAPVLAQHFIRIIVQARTAD